MTKEIKQRIDQIKNGEVPQGYKKTKIGIVPNEWEENLIGDCLERVCRPIAKPTEKYWRLGLRSHAKGTFHELVESPEKVTMDELYIVRENDFLLNITFAWEHAVAVANKQDDGKLVSHRFPTYIATNKCDINYWKHYSSRRNFKLQLELISPGGAGRNRVMNQSLFLKLPVILPPLNEQQKISDILSTQDKVIELKEKLLNEKEKQKKYLMQNLLTGRKRLKGFEGEWKKVKLGVCITEVIDKTNINNQYEILSVTRNGIVSQADHFNQQIASKNNVGYKILRYNQLVFSTLNLWMGSVDVLKTRDIGIVSPAYKIFDFNNKLFDADFGKYYMRSEKVINIYNLCSERGASVVRKNLDMESLMNTSILLPPLEEQKAIAEILTTADRELKLLQEELEEEKRKKKALMQLLLTGIVRVNS